MREERYLGELPAGPSSFKLALGLTGIVVVLGLLSCSGVAGYVALKGPTGQSADELISPMLDHSDMQTTRPPIVQLDLPLGFERIRYEKSDPMNPMTKVTFGYKTGEGAELIMGKVDSASIPADVSLEKLRGMMLQKLQMAAEHGRTFRRLADSIDMKRELTVLGQLASVEIIHGTLDLSAKRVAKVAGLFSTQKAWIAVVYIIPEDEYDEEAAVRMFESIKPASGDSIPMPGVSESPLSADLSGGPADKPARPEPADDDKPRSGQRTQPFAQ